MCARACVCACTYIHSYIKISFTFHVSIPRKKLHDSLSRIYSDLFHDKCPDISNLKSCKSVFLIRERKGRNISSAERFLF